MTRKELLEDLSDSVDYKVSRSDLSRAINGRRDSAKYVQILRDCLKVLDGKNTDNAEIIGNRIVMAAPRKFDEDDLRMLASALSL